MSLALAGFTALFGSFDIWFWRDQSDDVLFTDDPPVIGAGAADDCIYLNGAEIGYGNPLAAAARCLGEGSISRRA